MYKPPRARNIGFVKSALGESISKCNALAHARLSTILTLTFFEITVFVSAGNCALLRHSCADDLFACSGKIGFNNFLHRWVPNILPDKLRRKRVELAGQGVQVLQSRQKVGFHGIVTGSESLFLQRCDHRQIWRPSADEILRTAAQTMAAQKRTVAVILSVHGAIFINWLRPEERFNSGYFRQILHSERATGSQDQ
jgi:hypothetical protein